MSSAPAATPPLPAARLQRDTPPPPRRTPRYPRPCSPLPPRAPAPPAAPPSPPLPSRRSRLPRLPRDPRLTSAFTAPPTGVTAAPPPFAAAAAASPPSPRPLCRPSGAGAGPSPVAAAASLPFPAAPGSAVPSARPARTAPRPQRPLCAVPPPQPRRSEPPTGPAAGQTPVFNPVPAAVSAPSPGPGTAPLAPGTERPCPPSPPVPAPRRPHRWPRLLPRLPRRPCPPGPPAHPARGSLPPPPRRSSRLPPPLRDHLPLAGPPRRRPRSLFRSCRCRSTARRAAPSPAPPPLQSCRVARLRRLLRPRPSRRCLPRPRPRPRSRFCGSATSRARPAMLAPSRCPSAANHACAVATTPQQRYHSAPHPTTAPLPGSAARMRGSICTAPPPPPPAAAFPQFWCSPVPVPSRFRRCPATAGIPVPGHAASAATGTLHGSTASENCSGLRVSFRVCAAAGACRHPAATFPQFWCSPVPVPSRFRRCPVTAGIPVPGHAASAATGSVHGSTASENCSGLRVSFRVSAAAGACRPLRRCFPAVLAQPGPGSEPLPPLSGHSRQPRARARRFRRHRDPTRQHRKRKLPRLACILPRLRRCRSLPPPRRCFPAVLAQPGPGSEPLPPLSGHSRQPRARARRFRRHRVRTRQHSKRKLPRLACILPRFCRCRSLMRHGRITERSLRRG
ncbi:uncharacterized protein LOC129134609 [Agelaius phoeniceus]|uniref:uncharacterized protein LOC129134609 n=1 Tax=Agelaius phoeniceus TaxID=39638 RepID=UPI004054A622